MSGGGAARGPAPGAVALGVLAAVLASVAFYRALLFEGHLAGLDWGTHHVNYFDWVRTSLTQYRTFPLFMNDAWVTKNFLANAESPGLGPLAWLLWVLPADVYIKVLVVVFTAAGLLGMFLLLRDWGVSAGIAAFCACAFAWNGFFVSHLGAGHPWALGAQLLPALLLLYRRAVAGSGAALVLAAFVNAFTILGGQHQPFIWQNLFLAGVALVWSCERRSLRPLAVAAALAALSFGVGAVKLLPMLAEFADYAPLARTDPLPLSLLLTSLAGSGQSPELAPAGLGFPHGGGWWEYAFYVGPVALAALVAAAVFARGALALALVGGAFAVLAIAWPAVPEWLEPWTWLRDWPLWRTQRSPSRFLVLALFALTLLAGLGLERLWRPLRERAPRAATAAALLLVAALALDLHVESLAWQRAALGPAPEARDHRPHPLRLGEPDRLEARLASFAPNRLTYRVEAAEAGTLVFPVRLAAGSREWRLLDPGAAVARTQGRKLAVDVPPGARDLVLVYRPRLFHAGVSLTVLTLIGVGIATWRSKTSRA